MYVRIQAGGLDLCAAKLTLSILLVGQVTHSLSECSVLNTQLVQLSL